MILGFLSFGLPLWVAIPAALLLSGLVLGVLFKRLIVDPMLQHGVLPLVITTIVNSRDQGIRLNRATVVAICARLRATLLDSHSPCRTLSP